jgi:hypothetical protein
MRMAERCETCSVTLEREAGYFLGSIYFNSGVTCILAGVLYFGILFGLGLPHALALATAVGTAILFPFWFWRYARSLWLMLDQYVDPRDPPVARVIRQGS